MHLNQNVKVILASLLLVCGAGIVRAAEHTGRTVITSDTLLFDYQRSIAIFEGQVRVEDGQVTLTCQKLYVYFDDENQIDSVVARENVHVVQGDRQALAGKAVYTAKDGSILLTEKPRLLRGTDELRGDEIRIFTHSQKVISKPGRLVVFPREDGQGISLPR